MARLKIKDAPLLPSIQGDEKIPTGMRGDYTITPDMLSNYIQPKLPFATKSELTQVEYELEQQIETVQTTLSTDISTLSASVTSVESNMVGFTQDLTLHTNNENNPHKVTKQQIGLGSVDNTSDINKPVSNPTKALIDESFKGGVVAPDLPTSSKLRVIAGSIRNTGDGWKWISDSAHTPIGVTPTVTVSGTSIVINYGFTAKKVVSLVATPDETFASLGFIIGGSVGTSLSNLQIKAPLAFTVDSVSGAITAPSFVLNAISSTISAGTCIITHPSVGATGDAPSVTKIGSVGGHTDTLASYGTSQSILYGAGDLDGQILYDGQDWKYSGELKTSPTMVWVKGGGDAYLKVDHLQADVFNINIQSRTKYTTSIAGISGNEFRVRFYDVDGTLKLDPTNEMQFMFSRKAYLPKNVIRGLYSVKRGYAGLLPNDLISASGNIWIYGVMEI